MYKNGVLTIDYDVWKYGISSSPYNGISDMRNLDPHTKAGVLRCGAQPTDESDATVTSFPKSAALDPTSGISYFGLEEGKLIQRSASASYSLLTISPQESQGTAFWKGHTFTAGETYLEVYDIDAPFFYSDWKQFEEGRRNSLELPHQILIGQDDVMYICDGRYIASLQEVIGETFDPNDATTYTWNSTALDLPEGVVASSLTEIGTYLLIGTYEAEVLNRGNRADFYPWDRVSDSFGIPIRSKGNGVWNSISHNNRVFSVLDTLNPRITETNLSSFQTIKELQSVEGTARLYPDAITAVDDEILFGIGSSDSNSANLGIYGLKNGLLHLKNTLSCGDVDVNIGTILDLGDGEYLVTWKSATDHGVDIFSSNRATGYISSLETGVVQVGTALNPKQFQTIEVVLGKPLATGQGVRVSYRPTTDDAYTVIGTYDYDTYGAVASMGGDTNITDLVTGSWKVELTSAASSDDSPELISVTIA